GSRFEHGNRRSPMVALYLAARVVVQGEIARNVARVDRRAAGDVLEVARELRPEAGFEIDVLTNWCDSKVDKRRLDSGDGLVEFLWFARDRHDRQVMLAVGDLSSACIVERLVDRLDLRQRQVFSLLQNALLLLYL